MTRRAQIDVVEFGRRLRRFLKTDESYEILGDVDGTWRAGGCWILSDAISAVLGAPLAAVWSFVGGTAIQQHVVIEAGPDLYLDADGAQSGAVLLRKMEQEESLVAPYLAPFDRAAATEGGIVCPRTNVRRLRTALGALLARRK